MKIARTIDELRSLRDDMRGTVGLVPTMGALHEGHMALVEAACAANDTVIATIFVNPTQFGPNEDLSSYPRTPQDDIDALTAAGVDVLFMPAPDVIYPPGFQTYVMVEQVAQPLEGAHRPGHFRGVATVVAKLFNLAQPTRAYFGQKDAQQVVVLKQLVRDLNFPLRVVVVPTVREADGLAKSSRNAYLSPEERAAATVLYQSLQAAADAYEQGVSDADALRHTMQSVLKAEPLAQVDYVSAAHPVTLDELKGRFEGAVLLSLTVQVGKPRLLDNMLLPRSLNTIAGLSQHLGVS